MIKFTGVVVASIAYFVILLPLRFYRKEDLKVLDLLSKKSPVGKVLFVRVMGVIQKHV